MKLPNSLVVVVGLMAALSPIGCGEKQSSSPNPTVAAITVDTSKLQSAFASAKGELKANLDRAVNAISDRDFSGAVTFLQKIATDAGLTEEQKSAVKELAAQVKERSAELMQSAGKAAGSAVDQAKEAAGKAATQVKESAGSAVDAAGKAATESDAFPGREPPGN